MNTRLSLLIVLIILGHEHALSQTADIAYKSHSGQDIAYIDYTQDRFGEYNMPPMMQIERVMDELDTLTIISYGYGNQAEESYTVTKHPVFNRADIDIDSLKASYPDSIIWIGFDNVPEIEINKEKRLRKNGLLPPLRIVIGLVLAMSVITRIKKHQLAQD